MAARGRSNAPNLMARAVAILARREHSRAELAGKLRRSLTDEDDPAELPRVLDSLERDKLLSDDRFAGVLTRSRSARFGDARIRFELKKSGVKAEAAAGAVAALKGTELERAQAVWSRRFGELPRSPQERARQARFLESRGFAGETIRKVLRGLPGDD
jgi:regulatory protein